jgi:CDP-glucose 4,6-dehydratase
MKNLFNGVYKNKNILVTGHTGFKGSWLVLWLQHLGAKVTGYALPPPTQPNHYDLLHLECNSIIGDIRDLNKLSKTFQQIKPDIVFHLAAQPLVRYSYQYPKETFEVNAIGTVNIFEASRITPSVKAIINITSDKCYDNREWLWGYREIDPLGGNDPYSASKGCAELITHAYQQSFFNVHQYGATHQTLIASVRAGNVIGGGDWAADRLIPDIVRATIQEKNVTIRYPNAIRPWQHVLEPLHGYLLLGQKLLEEKQDYSGAWNFGPDDKEHYRVLDVVTTLKAYWNKINYEIDNCPQCLHEAQMLKLDCSKAASLLHWKSIWTSEETFKHTAVWYQSFYEENMILSSQQLFDYTKRI